ncbi:MAG: rhomboid family intramembrane serine protease [Balneolaceae bacterium]|nr:rhomboid family intramembrane serine protease [Balneolaceae bacterium]
MRNNMAYDSFGNTAKRGFMGLPVAIRTIIAINAIMFLVQIIFASLTGTSLTIYLSFIPDLWTAITQPWRIVTYMFLHSLSNPFHFIFNMLWLWWMGRPVEERIGPRSFLTVYFGAGFAGAFIDIIVSIAGNPVPVIGASGAVYGIMVAFAMLFPRTPIMLIFLPPIEARYVVSGLIALDVLFLNSGDNVARFVHLGGALGGYMLMRAHANGTDLSLIPRYFEYLYMKFKPKNTSSSSSSTSKKPKNKKMSIVSDAEIIEEVEQSELDEILEKISKSGYDSLSKEEKRKLFELSKKN